MQGNLTLKCDVYSFGVVILNIISGPRERTKPPLLSFAWDCWSQHKIENLLDSAMEEPEFGLLLALEKCVQIGLLCVQQLPDDRPTMSAVVTMLNSDDSEIYPPKMPISDDHSSTGSPSQAVFNDGGVQRDTVDLT
ncbi:cysteine-rich receptor-like protein kinase 44 [Miscanthus floridulus]|uniref:cysteine-rich receptor-like protein kinase 44 n=1 Tax=Miscanthus floridulus TaxID=154761 RepID=UPI003459FB20